MGIFYAYLVVFSLYLAITKKNKKKRLNRRRRFFFKPFLIKVDKGRGGGGGEKRGCGGEGEVGGRGVERLYELLAIETRVGGRLEVVGGRLLIGVVGEVGWVLGVALACGEGQGLGLLLGLDSDGRVSFLLGHPDGQQQQPFVSLVV